MRKWLRQLPHPFSRKDRAAGYRCPISILQAEFSLTQVLKQPVAGLRYADPRVQAVLSALLGFSLLVRGFTNRQLRERAAGLLGQSPESWTAGRMTYELRRLRLHGLIERVKRSHRYQLTQRGIQVAAFFTRSYARILRPGLAQITGQEWDQCSALRSSFDLLLRRIDEFVDEAKLAA